MVAHMGTVAKHHLPLQVERQTSTIERRRQLLTGDRFARRLMGVHMKIVQIANNILDTTSRHSTV